MSHTCSAPSSTRFQGSQIVLLLQLHHTPHTTTQLTCLLGLKQVQPQSQNPSEAAHATGSHAKMCARHSSTHSELLRQWLQYATDAVVHCATMHAATLPEAITLLAALLGQLADSTSCNSQHSCSWHARQSCQVILWPQSSMQNALHPAQD